MNKLLIKQLSILSALLGGILGLLALIPIVRNIAALILMVLLAPIVIIYLKKLNLIDEVSLQNGAISGVICGVVSVVAFFIVFAPLVLLFGIWIKNGYIGWIASLIKSAGFFVSCLMLFFIGLLSGLMNAFSGLTTAYVYEMLKKVKDW